MNDDLRDCGEFFNDDLQELLLLEFDHFTGDGKWVDPHDGRWFQGPGLDELIRQMESAVSEVSSRPPEWPLLDEPRRVRYYEMCRIYNVEALPPRDQALHSLHQAILLATKARERNEALVFHGD